MTQHSPHPIGARWTPNLPGNAQVILKNVDRAALRRTVAPVAA